MSPQDFFESFRRLHGDLPFDVDDLPAATDAFQRWRGGDATARDPAALWTYLYLLRYFARKFLAEPSRAGADLDALLAQTYGHLLAHADAVREPHRYPAWVSVVARNAFRAYLRRTPLTLPLPDGYDPADDAQDAPDGYEALDPGSVRDALRLAINRLPDYLRAVATQRLLDQADYETIAMGLGKDVQVVRTYAKKALDRLRDDDRLRALLG